MRTTEFFRLLHAFQAVERATVVPDLSRKENDIEHSYLLTMLCWYLANTLDLALDTKKLIEYALVHDFIEVYAGDTYFLDAEALRSKHEREEASRLRIATEFPEFTDMHERIAQYEKREDPEARFVYEVDKLIPLMTNYTQDGFGWKQYNVQPDELFANKRERIQDHPEVRSILEQFILELDTRRSEFFNQKW